MSDIDDNDDDLPPTPVARPNVYGPNQATELATSAWRYEPIAAALGERISAGHRIVSAKQYAIERKSKRFNRKKWF